LPSARYRALGKEITPKKEIKEIIFAECLARDTRQRSHQPNSKTLKKSKKKKHLLRARSEALGKEEEEE
jgi:hypothetical protein